jgi:Multicopper oxidase
MNQGKNKSWRALASALTVWLAAGTGGEATAAVPGIVGGAPTATAVTFDLTASDAMISQPDGSYLYSWGYGCKSTPVGYLPAWSSPGQAAGAAHSGTNAAMPPVCPQMQIPGPTMIVNEGQTVTVTLTNGLPIAAGNTSIVFPGFQVTATGGTAGANAQEAQPQNCTPTVVAGNPVPCNVVTYTFVASKPGTYAYYSGSQADLQIDMGLYGAIIVLPAATAASTGCKQGPYSLAASAYDNIYTCYDREYLFQLSEMSAKVHQAAQAQVQACAATLIPNPAASCPTIAVETEPYRPDYFLVNGRSMPDDMDPHYFPAYVHQPYGANPHMLPGENMLIRFIGQGRIQHPFHIHGNHARVVARDGNLVVSATDIAASVPVLNQRIAGPVLFTLPSVSGQTMDAVFNWTGKGLGWDIYGHAQDVTATGTTYPVGPTAAGNPSGDPHTCTPDANGFDLVTKEWCADHNKPIPVTPPDPIVVANGQWYSGTPYLGLQSASPNPLPPTGTRLVNDGGYAYMWHSHDEREITTQNVFPGGLMTMMIIDPPGTTIDETQ